MTRNQIELTATGLRLVDATGRPIDLFWADVTEVSAYAVDAISHTVRYLDFTLINGCVITVSTVSNRDDRWAEVLEAVPIRLGLRGADFAATIDALTPDDEPWSFAASRP